MKISRLLLSTYTLLVFTRRLADALDEDRYNGCQADSEYTLAVDLKWNKRPHVLPRYHLSFNKVIFVVHTDRFRLLRVGRKAQPGLANFIETGGTNILAYELGEDGDLQEGYQANKKSDFTANMTVSYFKRYLTVVGRIDNTPDWIAMNEPLDLCNFDSYFSRREDWKLGDYKELNLYDAGTFITPTTRNARPRAMKPILYSKEEGYKVSKSGSTSIGVLDARRRACPVFGTGAYPVGAEWMNGPCVKCRCEDTNRDVCVREFCPPPPCEYFVFQSDVCCPVCQTLSEYLEFVEKSRNPDPPVIVKKPRNVTVSLGASVTFDCTSWGDPKPEVQLMRNNPEDFVHIHQTQNTDSDPGLASSSLKIDTIAESDAGRYTCFASGVGGLKEEHAWLTIKR